MKSSKSLSTLASVFQVRKYRVVLNWHGNCEPDLSVPKRAKRPSEPIFDIETRVLRAVIALAERLNFTRTALKLHISQPALSKQIAELEERFDFQLFTRSNKRVVELTEAGRVFVEKARSVLMQMQLAVRLAHAAHEGHSNMLIIGHSPYADQNWISSLIRIRLRTFPDLRISIMTMFAPNLVQSVRTGELNLALVTAPEDDDQIIAEPFARAPLYVALLETHPAALSDRVVLADLAEDDWILFAREVHPMVHDAILDRARHEGIAPKKAHDIMGVRQAIHLVSEGLGIAILSEPLALEIQTKSIVVKPISDKSLSVPTCLVMRADDKSPLTKEFAHAFLSRFTGRPPMPAQLELFRSSKDSRLA
jgi:DNA-binding transcriptional LysR family regulator